MPHTFGAWCARARQDDRARLCAAKQPGRFGEGTKLVQSVPKELDVGVRQAAAQALLGELPPILEEDAGAALEFRRASR